MLWLLGVTSSAHTKSFEDIFFERYDAPYLTSQTAAFERVRSAMRSLPHQDRAEAERRFGAFALRSPGQRQHCLFPHDLAGVEVMEGRQDGLLFICQRAMMVAAQSVATALIIAVADVPAVQKEDAFDRWLHSTGPLAAGDFQQARQGRSLPQCAPAYLAYIYLRKLPPEACMKLDPPEVRSYMWPRMRPAMKAMEIEGLDKEDSATYWTLERAAVENTLEVIFNFAVFHELGHLVRSDPWGDRSLEEAEMDADTFAFAALDRASADDEALTPMVSMLMGAHMMAVAHAWSRLESGLLLGRVQMHGSKLLCTLKARVASKMPGPAVPGASLGALLQAHERVHGKLECPRVRQEGGPR